MTFTKTLIAAAVAMAVTTQAAAMTVVAHRGLWQAPGSAQNSIRSLLLADSIGSDASEFDVWRTKDGLLIVNHDKTINGIDIENCTSDVVLAQTLENGETVPTLEQYLAAAKPLKTKLIIEVKPHNSYENDWAAIRNTIALVKKYGLEDRAEYVTFSKNGILAMRNTLPEGTPIHYPGGDYLPGQLKSMGGTGLYYSLKVLKAHPQWIKEAHDLGLTVGAWTINTPEEMQWCIDNGVDFVTSNIPETSLKMTKTQTK